MDNRKWIRHLDPANPYGGLTMTVFENGKAMTTFRDRGAHRLVMALLSWVFFSGRAQAYFLTFSAHGQIPTAAEARALALEHGRFFDGGKLVRPASKPVWGTAAS